MAKFIHHNENIYYLKKLHYHSLSFRIIQRLKKRAVLLQPFFVAGRCPVNS